MKPEDIPDAAVVAAAQALYTEERNAHMSGEPWPTWEQMSPVGRDACRDDARVALAAAIPHLLTDYHQSLMEKAATNYSIAFRWLRANKPKETP